MGCHGDTHRSWWRSKCLGRGCFGTVSLAVDRAGRRTFAAKSVDLATTRLCQLDSLENEIRVLRSLPSSPHVVGFLGDDVTREGTSSFRNLLMEYVPGGTLADLGYDEGNETLLRRHVWHLVSALSHVHASGFVHCDVKGRNVLVEQSSAKLADFGSAMEIGSDASAAGVIVPRGSPLWMAPEVVRQEYQGPESDVWSLGCTVIEMVTGKPPWSERGLASLRQIACSGKLPEFPSGLSQLGRDFLEKCLRIEPRKRWTCDQLLQHEFLLPEFLLPDHAIAESSPRRVLDWVGSELEEEVDSEPGTECFHSFPELSARDRIGNLATGRGPNWESEGWVMVRDQSVDGEGTTSGCFPPEGQGYELCATMEMICSAGRPWGPWALFLSVSCNKLMLWIFVAYKNSQLYVVAAVPFIISRYIIPLHWILLSLPFPPDSEPFQSCCAATCRRLADARR